MGRVSVEVTMRAGDPNKLQTKFEVVVIPVSDVGRAKEFYGRLGWRLDEPTMTMVTTSA